MMAFTLRYLEAGDCEWLRCLRNESRDAFFDMREITPEAQERWFSACPWGDQRWVIMDGETRCGYFSIERPKADLPVFPSDKPVWYLNALLVDPAHRGRGVIQAAAAAFDDSLAYCGYVRAGNGASLRACAKLGLADRGIYNHPVYGPMHLVFRP